MMNPPSQTPAAAPSTGQAPATGETQRQNMPSNQIPDETAEWFRSYDLADARLMDGGRSIKLPTEKVEELIDDNEELLERSLKMGDHISDQGRMIHVFGSEVDRMKAAEEEATAKRRSLEGQNESLIKKNNILIGTLHKQRHRIMELHEVNEMLLKEIETLSTTLREPCNVSEELEVLAITLQEQREMSVQLRALTSALHEQKDLARKLKSLASDLQEQQGLNAEIKNHIEALQRQGGQFKKLMKAKRVCAKLRTQWITTKQEMERLRITQQEMFQYTYKVSDELIISVWGDLTSAVRRLAAKASSSKQDFISPTLDQRDAFGGLIPQFEKYFTTYTPVLFEALIWANICQFIVYPCMVWSRQGDGFVGTVFQSDNCKFLMDRLHSTKDQPLIAETANCNTTSISRARYNKWRYETGRVLYENRRGMVQLNLALQETLVEEFCLILAQCSANGVSRGELAVDVCDIVQKLLEFGSLVAQAPVRYIPYSLEGSYPTYPDRPIPFVKEEMEYRLKTKPESAVVDLLVSPGLAKISGVTNTSNGQCIYICKSGVAF